MTHPSLVVKPGRRSKSAARVVSNFDRTIQQANHPASAPHYEDVRSTVRDADRGPGARADRRGAPGLGPGHHRLQRCAARGVHHARHRRGCAPQAKPERDGAPPAGGVATQLRAAAHLNKVRRRPTLFIALSSCAMPRHVSRRTSHVAASTRVVNLYRQASTERARQECEGVLHQQMLDAIARALFQHYPDSDEKTSDKKQSREQRSLPLSLACGPFWFLHAPCASPISVHYFSTLVILYTYYTTPHTRTTNTETPRFFGFWFLGAGWGWPTRPHARPFCRLFSGAVYRGPGISLGSKRINTNSPRTRTNSNNPPHMRRRRSTSAPLRVCGLLSEVFASLPVAAPIPPHPYPHGHKNRTCPYPLNRRVTGLGACLIMSHGDHFRLASGGLPPYMTAASTNELRPVLPLVIMTKLTTL